MTTLKTRLVELADLSKVRLTCKKCQGTIEVDAMHPHKLHNHGECRLCGEIFFQATANTDPLKDLRSVLLQIEKMQVAFSVEFAIVEGE